VFVLGNPWRKERITAQRAPALARNQKLDYGCGFVNAQRRIAEVERGAAASGKRSASAARARREWRAPPLLARPLGGLGGGKITGEASIHQLEWLGWPDDR